MLEILLGLSVITIGLVFFLVTKIKPQDQSLVLTLSNEMRLISEKLMKLESMIELKFEIKKKLASYKHQKSSKKNLRDLPKSKIRVRKT